MITSSRIVDGLQVQVMRDETELEGVRRARDTVLANVSHEFRTPLAAQLASIELLREGLKTSPPEKLEELVLSLERGTLRLTRLIDNLLESVRIESGQLDVRRQSIELGDVVEDARALVEALLRQRRQPLEVDVPDGLELQGDATRLTQVFVNLIANASKFAPEGTPIRVGARVDGNVSQRLGRGLGSRAARGRHRRHLRTLQARRRAGARARRAGPRACGSRARSSSATGAASRAARTAEGCTRFTLTLPVEPQGSRMKILVADDDLDLLGLVAYSLSQAGYLVVKASDGPGALATFDAESPDLVILDINMPGASGFEVCTAIRARGDVPVMMLTARGEEQDLVKALELGADDYLTKPFSPKTLLARVKALLRRASAERSARAAVRGPRDARSRRTTRCASPAASRSA